MQHTYEGAHVETFEHEQQRRFLTQLLASPSELCVHAAAFGISPAAFRLKCWKVRSRPQCQHFTSVAVTAPCSPVCVCVSRNSPQYKASSCQWSRNPSPRTHVYAMLLPLSEVTWSYCLSLFGHVSSLTGMGKSRPHTLSDLSSNACLFSFCMLCVSFSSQTAKTCIKSAHLASSPVW